MSNTDLSGKPPTAPPEFQLNKWQKRQATLLYHFASLDYLKGLKKLLDDFVNGVDITLDLAQQQGRDQFIANERWGVRDTAANFSTYGFPALKEFQRDTNWDIAKRKDEFYDFTGYNQCARLLGELSLGWSTPEEQERFEAGLNAIGRYASPLDSTLYPGRGWDDYSLSLTWAECANLFPRLPKFRVCTDVEGESGKLPSRTGVYVPQDDPYGTLQFAWTGNDDGRMSDCDTFNDLGLQALNTVGRDALWTDDPRLLPIVKQPQYLADFKKLDWFKESNFLNDVTRPKHFIGDAGFTRRPCKWYLVEPIEGEYEDPEPPPDPYADRLRALPGEVVPKTGWWRTLAIKGEQGFRRFEQGERFPETHTTAWGSVIWNFNPENQPQQEASEPAWNLPQVALPQPSPDANVPAAQAGVVVAAAPAPSTEEAPAPPQTSSPPAEPARTEPSRIPLGKTVATGDVCPQTGWWEPIDAQGRPDGPKRQFAAGQTMPEAVYESQPSLWQKLKGEHPVSLRATAWRLVEVTNK